MKCFVHSAFTVSALLGLLWCAPGTANEIKPGTLIAQHPPRIGVIGCILTGQHAQGYRRQSNEDRLVNVKGERFADQGVLDYWVMNSRETTRNWAIFDRLKPYDAIWIQPCVRPSNHDGQMNSTHQFQIRSIIERARSETRPDIPIWISPANSYTSNCDFFGERGVEVTAQIADWAASEDLAMRGPDTGPVDRSQVEADGCMLNESGEDFVGKQLVEFFDVQDNRAFPAALSAAWFDIDTDGQGFNLQFSPGGLFGFFYGYAEGQPLWLLLDTYTEPVILGRPIFMDVLAGAGGVFGDPADPAENPLPVWGELMLTFQDCSSAHAVLEGDAGTQEFDLVVLAGADGVDRDDCTQPLADSPLADLTAAWFEPATSGQGWNFIHSPAGIFGFFYGYTEDGEPLWLITEEIIDDIELQSPVTWTLLRGSGGQFTDPVPPEQLEEWGTAEVTFDNCQQGVVDINGQDGTQMQQIVKLTPTSGIPECQ